MTWPAATAPARASQSSRAQAVMPGCRAHHHRCISDAAGDHHVGPGIERLDDAPAAQVGVGGDHPVNHVAQRLAGIDVGQRVSGSGQHLQAIDEVVAVDHRHRHLAPCGTGRFANRLGAPVRVEATGVGHHLDAPVETGGEHLMHLRGQTCVRSRRRRAEPWFG
jgi:hypothetical protein